MAKKEAKKAPAKPKTKAREFRGVRVPMRQDAFTKFAELSASQDKSMTQLLSEMVDAQLAKSLGIDAPITRPLIRDAERKAKKAAKK